MSKLPVTSFKAYDIRGKVPEELNGEIAYAIGRAFVKQFQARNVVVGHDIRLSSPEICESLVRGLRDAGSDVSHIGQCGTEEIYFATDHYHFDGGIIVTASHNPKAYNGLKLVRENSRPISGDTGLNSIKEMVARNDFGPPVTQGTVTQLNHRKEYIDHLLSYADTASMKPLKIVANPGNGAAGAVVSMLADRLPVEIVELFPEPDGNFPNGVPNPLLPENRQPTIDKIRQTGADLGVAWDGDFDRCFFFDDRGRFIEGYYIVGLLAEAFLSKDPGSKIVHDPRLIWNTVDVVSANGGTPILTKTGHAFIKEKRREVDAVYGGEMSAHHYFRDFAYCDSGMIPWLLMLDLISRSGKSLAELVEESMVRYPVSSEINRKLENAEELLGRVEEYYRGPTTNIDYTDGLSMDFADWRFNIRSSNTEPLVRLNVETRGDAKLMQDKTEELLALMASVQQESNIPNIPAMVINARTQ